MKQIFSKFTSKIDPILFMGIFYILSHQDGKLIERKMADCQKFNNVLLILNKDQGITFFYDQLGLDNHLGNTKNLNYRINLSMDNCIDRQITNSPDKVAKKLWQKIQENRKKQNTHPQSSLNINSQ